MMSSSYRELWIKLAWQKSQILVLCYLKWWNGVKLVALQHEWDIN